MNTPNELLTITTSNETLMRVEAFRFWAKVEGQIFPTAGKRYKNTGAAKAALARAAAKGSWPLDTKWVIMKMDNGGWVIVLEEILLTDSVTTQPNAGPVTFPKVRTTITSAKEI